MADDNFSATQSELNTFKVLTNLDFTDLRKPEPHRRAESPPLVQIDERSEAQAEERSEARSYTSEKWGGSEHEERRENRHEARRSEDRLPRDDSVQRRDDSQDKERREQRRSEERRYADHSDDRESDRHSDRHSAVSVRQDAAETVYDREYARAQAEAEADVALEKESLLYELDLMEKQGVVKLHRQLTMKDSLEAIQYQYDRANMIASSNQTVEWAKMSIRFGSGILENITKTYLGITAVDGFSGNLCKDMNKFNKPLTKMYRKYWRRGSSSPEMELAMIVFGALVMTIATNKGWLGTMFGGRKPSGPSGQPATEPFARPLVPGNELRPPMVPGFVPASAAPTVPSVPTVPSAPVATPPIPEWARAALAAPAPHKPAHFAQALGATVGTPIGPPVWPELNRAPPAPVLPVPASVQTVVAPPVQTTVASTAVSSNPLSSTAVSNTGLSTNPLPMEIATKRISLGTGSPKTARRKKDLEASAINLDE